MELEAAAAARAFVLQWSQRNRSGMQAELEQMLHGLIELEALLQALDGVPGDEAAFHRGACVTARTALAARFGARLRIWRELGGDFVLTPPESDDGRAATNIADGTTAAAVSVPGDGTAFEEAGAGSGPEADGAATEVDARTSERVPDELLAKLQRHFMGDTAPWDDDDTTAYLDQSTTTLETVSRLQEALTRLTLPQSEPPPDWDDELARLQQCTANIDTEWQPFPSELQRDLLALVAAHARYVQEHHPRATEEPASRAITAVFGRLGSFSKTYWPGMVHGLNHQHTPRNGTWLADARGYLARLRSIAGLEDGMPRPKRQPERSAAPAKGDAVRIDDFLQSEGFLDEAPRAVARTLMETAKLTRPGKERMEAAKQERARVLFQHQRLRVCDSDLCRWLRTRDGVEGDPVEVAARYCDVCSGSDNRREALAMSACMSERGLRRLLVVGGSDDTRTDLQMNVPESVELKLVDGVGYHTQKDARANMQWAEVMAVWGATELDHKVSNLYRRPPAELINVTLVQRGVAALCREVRLRLYPEALPGG